MYKSNRSWTGIEVVPLKTAERLQLVRMEFVDPVGMDHSSGAGNLLKTIVTRRTRLCIALADNLSVINRGSPVQFISTCHSTGSL